MAVQLYYEQNGRRKGPFPDLQIEEFIRKGTIRPETPMWSERRKEWVRADKTILARYFDTTAGEKACVCCMKGFDRGALIDFNQVLVCAECKPVLIRRFQEGEMIQVKRYADFGSRVAAKFLDLAVLGAAMTVFLVGIAILLAVFEDTELLDIGDWFAVVYFGSVAALVFLTALIYNVFPVMWWSGTPGKLICGLRVTNLSGGRISGGTALLRFFCSDVLNLFIVGLGYLLALSDPEQCALHDRICQTRVANRK